MQKLKSSTAKIGRVVRTRLFLVTALAISFAIVTGAVMLNTNTILVKDKNAAFQIYTLHTDAEEILDQAGISLNLGDEIDFSGIENRQGTLEVLRAFNVYVYADSVRSTLQMTEGTVSEAIRATGITLYEADEVNHPLNSQVTPDMKIEVTRAFNVKITADSKEQTIKAANGTVADALTKAGITLSETDGANYPLDTPLTKDMEIKIARVSFEMVTKTETVRYSTVKENSKTLETGKTETAQKGVNGEKSCTYKNKIVDGKIVESVLIKSETTKKPVDEKILVGIKKKVTAKPVNGKNTVSQLLVPDFVKLDANGIPKEYERIITGTATAYSPKDGSTTSTGKSVKPGYVAVDPDEIPYGTKLYIVSADGQYNYGYAIAADTGGAVKSGRIVADLFFGTVEECFQFGKREIIIYVLE